MLLDVANPSGLNRLITSQKVPIDAVALHPNLGVLLHVTLLLASMRRFMGGFRADRLNTGVSTQHGGLYLETHERVSAGYEVYECMNAAVREVLFMLPRDEKELQANHPC
jgi:hypothetical protein